MNQLLRRNDRLSRDLLAQVCCFHHISIMTQTDEDFISLNMQRMKTGGERRSVILFCDFTNMN